MLIANNTEAEKNPHSCFYPSFQRARQMKNQIAAITVSSASNLLDYEANDIHNNSSFLMLALGYLFKLHPEYKENRWGESMNSNAFIALNCLNC